MRYACSKKTRYMLSWDMRPVIIPCLLLVKLALPVLGSANDGGADAPAAHGWRSGVLCLIRDNRGAVTSVAEALAPRSRYSHEVVASQSTAIRSLKSCPALAKKLLPDLHALLIHDGTPVPVKSAAAAVIAKVGGLNLLLQAVESSENTETDLVVLPHIASICAIRFGAGCQDARDWSLRMVRRPSFSGQEDVIKLLPAIWGLCFFDSGGKEVALASDVRAALLQVGGGSSQNAATAASYLLGKSNDDLKKTRDEMMALAKPSIEERCISN